MQIVIDYSAIERGRRLMAEYPNRLSKALFVAMKNSIAEIMFRLKDRVHVITGNLRRSWQAKPIEQNTDGVGWVGGMGSTAPYAAAEEYGFHGEESVRAYTRRIHVTRATSSGARVRLSKEKIAASGIAFVSAHTRHANQPAHPYANPAMSESEKAVQRFHELAINAAWNKSYGAGDGT